MLFYKTIKLNVNWTAIESDDDLSDEAATEAKFRLLFTVSRFE